MRIYYIYIGHFVHLSITTQMSSKGESSIELSPILFHIDEEYPHHSVLPNNFLNHLFIYLSGVRKHIHLFNHLSFLCFVLYMSESIFSLVYIELWSNFIVNHLQ